MARTSSRSTSSSSQAKSGDNAGEGKKALIVKIAVIVICLGGGAFAFFTLDRAPEVKITPEVIAAEQKAAEIQKQMEAAKPATPQPEPPPLTGEPGPNRMRKAPGT